MEGAGAIRVTNPQPGAQERLLHRSLRSPTPNCLKDYVERDPPHEEYSHPPLGLGAP